VHLVDTPGFDDTTKSDTETLAEVATWLAATYRSQIRLTGILYLQRITDNRFGGCAMQNLKMFKKMCGQSCLPNVVLMTTMWGGSREQLALQEARELQLKTSDDFWAGLIRLGAQAKRYIGTRECGLAIIEDMLSRPQIVLDIQRQIVDEGKNLNETAAGQQLREDMAKAGEKFQEELRQARDDMAEALRQKDAKLAEELKRNSEKLEEKMRHMDRDKQRLEHDLQKQLLQHQMIVQQIAAANQNTKWAVFGVAIGLLTGGLGMLAGVAVAGGGGAIVGLTALPIAQMAGELGRRAILGATQGALQLGSAILEEAGPQLAAKAIAAATE
jgi:hypothetical protein